MDNSGNLPLTGIRVREVTNSLQGTLAAQVMADPGAEGLHRLVATFNRMRWCPGGFPSDNALRPEKFLDDSLREREQKARQKKIVAAES